MRRANEGARELVAPAQVDAVVNANGDLLAKHELEEGLICGRKGMEGSAQKCESGGALGRGGGGGGVHVRVRVGGGEEALVWGMRVSGPPAEKKSALSCQTVAFCNKVRRCPMSRLFCRPTMPSCSINSKTFLFSFLSLRESMPGVTTRRLSGIHMG